MQVLRVWAHILLAVPGSRLVLKNKPFACEARLLACLPKLLARHRRRRRSCASINLLFAGVSCTARLGASWLAC